MSWPAWSSSRSSRRTLEGRGAPEATPSPSLHALLWTLHPLQTESVTYIIQRAESLMGLLYLLTLYFLIRGAGTRAPGGLWFVSRRPRAFCRMGTKEVMVSAPLVVLLYDRTFLAGGFAAALRRRWALYCALASTWVVLALLVLAARGRGGSAGFGSGVSPWGYALTQLQAVVHYMRLCLWPHPLVFDYGSSLVPPSWRLVPCAAILAILAAATAWALVRRPVLGFLGFCFFAVLAPSSSIVPVATETMAEHRMYLALIPGVVLGVAGMFRLLGRAALPACVALAAILAWATWQRNETYRSVVGLWADTVRVRPENERAHNNLGTALGADPSRLEDAIAQYEEAIRLKPDFAEAHYNLACDLDRVPGRSAEAISQYEEVLRLEPGRAGAHYNLACDLEREPGRMEDAIGHYEEALRLEPSNVDAHYNLGCDLARMPGRLDEATAQFREAVRLRPGYVEAHFNLGVALDSRPGRLDEAAAQFEEALRLRPGYFEAHYALAHDLEDAPGRLDEAIAHYRAALGSRPDDPGVLLDLALALRRSPGGAAEASACLERVVQLQPDNLKARELLAEMSQTGR
jgi:protein O-mannosyl-transferase